MEIDEAILAYLAGFFDGEGCVTINRNGSVQLRVINTSKTTLDVFAKTFGGRVIERKQRVNKKQYHWSVYGQNAIDVASLLCLYSIEKTSQLLILSEWWKERLKFQTFSVEGKKGRFKDPEREEAIKLFQMRLTEEKRKES